MIELKRGSGPGQWERAKGPARTVFVRCPRCGEYAGLNRHAICDDGRVVPSVVCPGPAEGCDWHEWVRLLDWK